MTCPKCGGGPQKERRVVNSRCIEMFRRNPWSANKDDVAAICDEAERSSGYRRALESARSFIIKTLRYQATSEVIVEIDAALDHYGCDCRLHSHRHGGEIVTKGAE